jgi:transglutaminase-like putative cysteine protease
MRAMLAAACLAVVPAVAGQVPGAPERISDIDLGGALKGERVQLVLVKDFMPLRNDGGTLKSVEFERYLAPCDAEQFVVARWVDAANDGGTRLPVSVAGVREDESGNLVQRYRLSPLPAKQFVTVTVTTLVARRERAAPVGEFPIPRPEEYPPEVRVFLSDSKEVAPARDRVVGAAAEKILARTGDAYAAAREVARLAKSRTYLPSGTRPADSVAGHVLENGGSCCASAVAAAAVLRRCGVPAQITYTPPASYVHGIVRFWLQGYGWVRMDATSGTGKLPLMQGEDDLALVRLFDMPLQMEGVEIAWAWPYHNTDDKGRYRFWSDEQPVGTVRFAARDEEQAAANGGVSGFVDEPFPHLEPGSWSALLGSEKIEGAWTDWDGLAKTAREGVMARTVGVFGPVAQRVPRLSTYVEAAQRFDRRNGPAAKP